MPGAHGGLAQLAWRHLAQALEAGDLDLALALEQAVQKFIPMGLVAGIGDGVPAGQAIERRLGDIEMVVGDQLRHLAIEEGHQERRDMGAIDIGIGHDDDPLVAQGVVAVLGADAAAQGLDQVAELLVFLEARLRGASDVENLAPERQHRLTGPVAGLLGRAAGRVAFDQEQLGVSCPGLGAIGQFAGQAQAPGGALAADLALPAPAQPFLGAQQNRRQQGIGGLRRPRQPMIEMIADDRLDEPRHLRIGELLLGLALELGILDEHRQHGAGRTQNVIAGNDGRSLFVSSHFGVILQASHEREA